MAPTSLQQQKHNNYVIVTRRINYRVHKIEFTHDVGARDLIPYFNMNDEDFLKLAVRLK